MADGLDKIKKQIAELLKSNKLTKESSDYYKQISASLDKSGATLGSWQRTLRSINDELDTTSDNLSYIATAFKESVQELQKGNVAINQQKSSLNKLSNIARDLRDIRQGEKEFTTDTLKKLQEKAKTEKSNLEIARNLLISQGKSTKAIESQINDANLLLKEYKNIEDVNNKINKEFGISSGLIKGLGAALKKAGFGDFSSSINEASMATSMMGQKAAQLGKPFNANATFAKNLTSNLSKSITPLKIFEVTIGLIVKSFMALDKMTGDLAKNLGISYNQSRNLNKEFSLISQNSDNIFVTTKNLNESFGQLADRFSVTAGFSNETLKTQLELTKQAGYQADSAAELAKLSLLTGESTDDILTNALGTAAAFNGQNKLALNEKKIVEDIAKSSASIQLSMGNSTTELVKAAINAKKFGMELSQVDALASSLMDFESSITNELEAELLLGKNINLEKARQAALNNDLATVAEEIAKQAGSAAEFTAMNRIQQEALAKAVGLSRDDLAKSLQEREALAKLGTDATTSQEAYNKLLSQGLSQEQIAAQLGDEKLADQLQANNIQERFNQSIQKAQEIFVNIASAISPFILGLAKGVEYIAIMVDKFSTILGIVGGIYSLNLLNNAANAISAGYQAKKLVAKEYELGLGGQILTLMGLENAAIAYKVARMEGMNVLSAIGVALEQTKLGAIVAQGIGMVKNLGKILIENAARMVGMATALATNSFATFGVGVAVALAAAAAGIMAVKSLTKADDLMSEGTSGSGYGGRVLLAGKDAFALNNSDTVLAGTNLGQGGGGGTDMSKTNKLLEKILGKTPEMAPLGLYEVQ
jgi:translation initiation factor 2 beta subunit (eIF-2beta)/eIF-5